MSDGAYYLKIVASDSPSNAPADSLETEMESDRFFVDNTAPIITGPKLKHPRMEPAFAPARKIPAATSRALSTASTQESGNSWSRSAA